MRSCGIDVISAVKKNAVPEMLSNAILEVNMECECGAVLEFDSQMKKIRCSDENCKCKILGEAINALKAIGISDDDIESLRDEIRSEIWGKCKAGCEILLSENERLASKIGEALKTELEFNKILSLTGIELLGKSSSSLLEGYRSIEDFYECMSESGIVEVARRLHVDKEIEIAKIMYDDIMRTIGVLMKIEGRLTVIIRQTDKKKQAGGGLNNSGEVIYTALTENAEQLNSSVLSENNAANKLVECINNKKRMKGADILKLV